MMIEVMPVTTDQQVLRAFQVEFFREQGFLSIPDLATLEEVAEIRSMLEELFRMRKGENEGAYTDLIESAYHTDAATSPQILNPVNYAPSLRKTQCFRNALKMAKQLLGDDAFCLFDLAILKKPAVGMATPWHQDEAFRDPRFEYNELSIWVSLQEVGIESGCMQFIPRSHNSGLLRHDSPNHDLGSEALECVDSFDKSTAVACPLPAGGCTIHYPRTLHGTGPNVSNISRLAYVMVFDLPPKVTGKERSFPWREQKRTIAQVRKRRWMRRGGLFVATWRRMRRGEVVSFASPRYFLKRFASILRKGN
jgi:ectoine hydroxylase-related dioxygenase (phytanoyl-CoA dioxygenase family)